MSIAEAAQLVIQAGAMTERCPSKGQAAPIYLLDMGEPLEIIKLAKSMINLSGLTLYDPVSRKGDIEIKITGLRQGEKLFEELLIGDDVENTFHPKIKVANESFLSWRIFQIHMENLKEALNTQDQVMIAKLLSELVSGFKSNNKKV
jgi:UDP-N-acetylglucosamine 4,6-dehydratase